MSARWLQRLSAPTCTAVLFMLVYGALSGSSPDGSLPFGADYLSRVAFSLIMASWVIADAHKRPYRLFYDYDSLVFFAWPIVLPIYLFRTRGWRAFLTILCFIGLVLLAFLAGFVTSFCREVFPAPGNSVAGASRVV